MATGTDPSGVRRPTVGGQGVAAEVNVDIVDLIKRDSCQLSPADWDAIGSAREVGRRRRADDPFGLNRRALGVGMDARVGVV
jgi:L-asparaginase